MLGQGGDFGAAIDAIYRAAVAPAVWPEALERIADHFDDVGALLIYQREDGSFGTIGSPRLATALRHYEDGEWWRHDIRFSRSAERGYLISGETITDRDIASNEEIERHPFYAEFLLSHGLRWFAGVALLPEPRIGVALAIQRAGVKPPYSGDELSVATRIARHVENALRIGIRLLNAEATTMALGDALGRLATGVFLLNSSSEVVYSNAAGQALIGDGLHLAKGRLTARFGPERNALASAVSAVLDGTGHVDTPRPVLVHGMKPDRFLAVYVLPVRMPSGHTVEHMFANVHAAVLVTRSKTDDPADPALVRDLLGVTLSEARVAALVASGLPPRDAASRLGISEENARTALKRVFGKTGVARQAELAALLMRLMVH